MSEQVNYDPFASGEVVRIVPVTEPQQEIWTATRISAKASCAFNAPLLLQFRGKLMYSDLSNAYSQLINRHDALRGSFSPDGDNFIIAENILVDLPLIEISGMDYEAKQKSLDEFIKTAAATPFNLEFGPLIRGQLLKFSDSEYYLLITVHHIVCDGWSTGILLHELAELYSAEVGKRQPNLLPAPSFADYASELHANQGSEGYLASKKYWLARYAGEPPVLDLPLDKPRPAKRTFNADRHDCFIDLERTRALTEIAASTRNTLFTTLFAAFQILIWKRSDQDDLVMGFSAAAQPITGNTELLGHCVNLLPIRFKLDGNKTFVEHLNTLRPHIYDALEHQEFSFGRLLKELNIPRDLSRVPLVPVVFNFETYSDDFNFAGVDTAFSPGTRSSEAFEIFLNVVSHPDKIELQCSYNTDLFHADTITRMLGHYENLLVTVCADKNQLLGKMSLMVTDDELRQLGKWNATAVDYPRELRLHDLIAIQVERTPDAIALEFEGECLSYLEFDERVGQLASYLQSLGVGPEILVAVFAERSIEMVVALHGIVRAGGAYVPVDPEYPEDRVSFMLEDTATTVLLTQSHLVENLPTYGGRVVCLDTQWEEIVADGCGLVDAVHADGLAYVIYTSGSTGRPKGVMNEHRGICNRLLWMQEAYKLTASDVVMQKTPFSFDVSVWEFFWPLMTGARLLVARPGGHVDPDYLVKLIDERGVTVMHFVPSMLHAFLGSIQLQGRCKSLRHVMCSGEALGVDAVQRFYNLFEAKLHNLYGPTEAAVDVTYWECHVDSNDTTIPIGRPVSNTQIYVLDDYLQPMPINVPGELHIGGVQVARGYLNREELTQEKFIADPFIGTPDAKLYKSGDLARVRADGVVEYLGRLDHQVKLRGFRIEPGEIESVLASNPSVKEAAVIVREDTPGDHRLIAYVVLVSGAELKITEMRQQAGLQLPDYMVPQHLVELDKLPLTPNGKLDRKALPAPTLQQSDDESFKAAETDLEIYLAKIWSKIFLKENIGVYDNFFEIGGHSLLAIQIVSTLSKDLETEIPLQFIFEHPCILDLAKAIEKQLIEELEKLSASEDVKR